MLRCEWDVRSAEEQEVWPLGSRLLPARVIHSGHGQMLNTYALVCITISNADLGVRSVFGEDYLKQALSVQLAPAYLPLWWCVLYRYILLQSKHQRTRDSRYQQRSVRHAQQPLS